MFREKASLNLFEREHVRAEGLSQKESSHKSQSSAVISDGYGCVPSFSGKCYVVSCQ